MIGRDDARRLLQLALDEFAPRWEIAADPVEVTIRDPHHWLSGIGTFGATLRDRTTGSVRVLGRRTGPEVGAAFHRGISGMVLEAFLEGSADPIQRYLREIGVAGTTGPSERLIASGDRVLRTRR
jgi:hypothetical protein